MLSFELKNAFQIVVCQNGGQGIWLKTFPVLIIIDNMPQNNAESAIQGRHMSRLQKSLASQLFFKTFFKLTTQKTSKLWNTGLLCEESAGTRWTPLIKRQWCRKRPHTTMSTWHNAICEPADRFRTNIQRSPFTRLQWLPLTWGSGTSRFLSCTGARLSNEVWQLYKECSEIKSVKIFIWLQFPSLFLSILLIVKIHYATYVLV